MNETADDEYGALICALLAKAGGRVEVSGQEVRDGLVAMHTRLRCARTSGDDMVVWLEPLTSEPSR